MSKRLNVVFDDETLYRALKVEAARRGIPAKDIVAAAVEMWLEAQEDAEDLALSLQAIDEYRAQGGAPADRFHQEVDLILAERGAS